MIKRPMLACSLNLTVDMLDQITYPKYVTPKIDGIRCLLLCKPEYGRAGCSPMSRKLKLIPNCHVQAWAELEGYAGLDGELVIRGKTFHETQSWVMTGYNLPQDFIFYAFDHVGFPERSYLQRLQVANSVALYSPKRIVILKPQYISSPSELQARYELEISRGGEGLIVRDGQAPYKQNRATWREQSMLKMKQFEDAEATVIGFEPEYANDNPSTIDNTGLAKRSSHKANLNPLRRLGKLLVRDSKGREFSIGSGFDHALKNEIWEHRSKYLGCQVTYKSQSHGEKDLPRCPIFKGFRYD